MRIIDAYYVACDTGKHSIVFQKRLALFLCLLAQGSFLEAREWTVYLYIQALDRYQEALATIQQIENSLQHDDGRIAVYIDIQGCSQVERFLIEKGLRTKVPVKACVNHLEFLKDGVTRAFSGVPQGKTLLILSGHGTGILAPTYNTREQKWFYEPDESSLGAPYKHYCAARYEQFAQQVQHIMEGKSMLSSQGGSFLSTYELRELMCHIHILLGKKLDILGFDSCYMAMLEIGYEVKDYVRYLIASQDCEDKEGWSYDTVIKALSSKSAAQVGRRIVYSYEWAQKHRGLDRFSLSVQDLGYSEELACLLDDLIQQLLSAENMLEPLCRARTLIHSVTGLPFYVDLKEFLETLYSQLLEGQVTQEIERICEDLLHAQEVLNLMICASVAGPSCGSLKGCSVYLPLAHIDSSYQGSFFQKHLWKSFLKYFTTGSVDCTFRTAS